MATKLNICYKGITQEFECARIIIIDDVTVIAFASPDDNMKLLLNFMVAQRIPVDPDDIKKLAITISSAYVCTTLRSNETYISPVKDDNVYDAYTNLAYYRDSIKHRINVIKRNIAETSCRYEGVKKDIAYLTNSKNYSIVITKRNQKVLLYNQLATLESELKEQTSLLEEVSTRLPIVDEVLIKRPLEDYATPEDCDLYKRLYYKLRDKKRLWKWERECYDAFHKMFNHSLLFEEWIELYGIYLKHSDKLHKLFK